MFYFIKFSQRAENQVKVYKGAHVYRGVYIVAGGNEMAKIFNKENINKVTSEMVIVEDNTGELCSIKHTKRIVSEVLDRVDIGVINKFLAMLMELDFIARQGNRYKVIRDRDDKVLLSS